jgi:hypothetical protein
LTNPRLRTARSARAIRTSDAASMKVPYGMRDERHGAAGLSWFGRPKYFAAARTSALVNPASASGDRTPRSRAACRPGR